MGKALILVDLQNDFLPGGALPVPQGNEVIPNANHLLHHTFDIKLATKDWHPLNHGSFAVNHKKTPGEVIELAGVEQILWPVHCVQDTQGADFSKDLNKEKIDKIFYKGTDKQIDSYSTFFDNNHRKSTGLAEFLRQRHIKDVFIAGLATDYCVLYSVLDARGLDFNTFVIADACRGIDLKPGDSERAFEKMKKAGAQIISLQEALKA